MSSAMLVHQPLPNTPSLFSNVVIGCVVGWCEKIVGSTTIESHSRRVMMVMMTGSRRMVMGENGVSCCSIHIQINNDLCTMTIYRTNYYYKNFIDGVIAPNLNRRRERLGGLIIGATGWTDKMERHPVAQTTGTTISFYLFPLAR